ncbi:MAG: 1-deoxy-D-xylulose-5-phosphate reductoisomerase [Pseudomonadota bacterium]|nr:1-deoxy-D-xylulose-5-phosphate reductoisomerase [Pseudomonadota bacterium]
MENNKKTVSILGSTGSIGCSTIDLIEKNLDRFTVAALTANRSVDLLVDQVKRTNAEFAVVADESYYKELKLALSGCGVEAAAGPQGLMDAASRSTDLVMAGIVGAAGLEPTLTSVKRGYAIALANKECLVCAGELMLSELEKSGATLLPVDSEHNAIFQVFDFENPDFVEKIILTASGGPFWRMTSKDMRSVTPEQAVVHPTWSMGNKISVDSATMMNKGLELIEAHYLFGLEENRIEVLVHPESIIHSLVSFVDGSILAQLGSPDMRTPISFALSWPKRMAWPHKKLSLADLGKLTFFNPDPERFPSIELAREALRCGGAMPTILNAANEIAVDAFLKGRIRFLGISALVSKTMERLEGLTLQNIDDFYSVDSEARRLATDFI